MANEAGALLSRYLLLVEALRDPELSKGDCVVLSVILAHVDKDGDAWPGIDRICSKAGISRSTAMRAVKNLEAPGYLRARRKIGCSNFYTVVTNPAGRRVSTSVTDDTGLPSEPVSGMTPTSVTDDTGTSAIDDTGPVSPVTPELVLRTRFNNSIQRTQLASPFDFDHEDKAQDQASEQKRLQEEEEAAARRESIRTEYVQFKTSHPKYAMTMERAFPKELEDLID